MTKLHKPAGMSPPKHLSKRAKGFWRDVNARYVLEAHDVERLRIACECIDTIDATEAAIRKDGRLIPDRYGVLKAHPAFAVGRDARQLLLRCIREMCVDVELPNEQRLPRQGRRYA